MSQLIIDLEITTDTTEPIATLEEFLAADQKPTAVFIDSDEDIDELESNGAEYRAIIFFG